MGAAGAAAAGLGYVAGIEPRRFRLRHATVPVLPPGSAPLRVLHISDLHLTPWQHRKIAWVRSLAELEPDLVVDTGDTMSHPRALPSVRRALEPLWDFPGVFVFGSNDYYEPVLKNPARYLWQQPGGAPLPSAKELPWAALGSQLTEAGWSDMTHQKVRLRLGDRDVEIAGIDDSHIGHDQYEKVAGPVDPGVPLHLGIMHSPEPRNLSHFAADGYDLLLAGHTHGGQLRLPGYGAIVTNCGIDRKRARGLSQHAGAWLHVSGGLGASPYAPMRFACLPEATLLTLVPRIR